MMIFSYSCPRCGRAEDIVSNWKNGNAPRLNCGECLMGATEIVTMTVTGCKPVPPPDRPKENPTDRDLLEACEYFLNMLPNERHPNNPHGFKTSYDLAAAVAAHLREEPAPKACWTVEGVAELSGLYEAGYTDETIQTFLNRGPK